MSRIAVVSGIRTPFVRAWTDFGDLPAQELGRIAVRELLERTDLEPKLVDEVILGSVANPPEAANIARVISLLAGIPKDKRAYTVSRNCASGFEAVTGAAESMSNIPMFYPPKTAKLFLKLSKARNPLERISLFWELLKPSRLLKPVLGLQLGLIDPVCGLNMGQTAEILAKEYGITRKEQDEFALVSHQRALSARERLKEEIVPVFVPPKYEKTITDDNGVRENIGFEDLAKLKPYFDRYSGTVTVGNSCQVTDGACAILVMREEKARELGFKPLGFIRAYAYLGVEPSRMGIGPAFAIPEVLKKAGLKLSDIELLEVNEAFAAQVIACERHLEAANIGKLNSDILNVNGGAIALGHPVGVTGSRLILTLLKEMKRRNLHLGLASLCVGGGQGAAVIV